MKKRVVLVKNCIWCEKPMKKFGTDKMLCSKKCLEQISKTFKNSFYDIFDVEEVATADDNHTKRIRND